MDTRASLSILLLLFGVSQASPLREEGFVSDPERVDITTRILETNNGSSEVLIEGDLVFPKTRNALICFNNNCFWKKNSKNIVEVPYVVSREYSSGERSVMANAMSTFHSKTCIRFVPRSTQTDYLSIENKDGFTAVWKSLKKITNYKTPPPSTVENQRLADDLNEFYCRF